MNNLNETILILGGDGYFGWPLAMKLAVQRPREKIIIVDNEWRRNTVRKFNSESLTPIGTPSERLEAFSKVHRQDNLYYIHMDVNSSDLDELIQMEKPHIIYHLAQQCSAPYSMKGLHEALYTLHNNEEGNMRLLWAVRQFVPGAQVIKLGSFGEYAKGGIDISEGYFYPEYNGQRAQKPMPFPRESDDIYHITKINDSNFVSMACRKWGLRITDVMQSTIFGLMTEEMNGCPELSTRFDYDEAFGTVLNRFLTQVVAGYPLTVYGTGHQSTGLMSLKDAVNSLAFMANTKSEKGKHRVINHITENYTINELAATVKAIAVQEGFKVSIKHDAFDPRDERPESKMHFDIDTNYLDHTIRHSLFTDIVKEMLKTIVQYQSRISAAVFPPQISWNDQKEEPVKTINKVVLLQTKLSQTINSPAGNESYWEKFREDNFPYRRINLNPGTIGAPSEPVENSRMQSTSGEQLESFPLGLYDEGRNNLLEIRKLCGEIWPAPGYEVAISHSTSQMINLLSLAMLRVLGESGKGPYRILTTKHEHYGGIGVFENLPEYEVYALEDEVLADTRKLKEKIKSIQPHLAFFSHVCYAPGSISPVEKWSSLIKSILPDCKIIVDAAQSLGLYELPFGSPDVIIASTHKWLFGPLGGGLIWMNENFRKWVEGFYWCGHYIDDDPRTAHFCIPGGQDFLLYPGILAALKLYNRVGKETVRKRSSFLAMQFKQELTKLFSAHQIEFCFLDNIYNPKDTGSSAVVTLAFAQYDPYELYKYLNEHLVHIKCIKDYEVNGQKYNLLRFGIPYFETIKRLNHGLDKIEIILSELSWGRLNKRWA